MRKLLLLFGLLCGTALAQQVDATATFGASGTGSTGLTHSFAVANHPRRVLYVAVAGLGTASTTISSITYNGASLTKVASCGGGWTCDIYRLIAPATGTHDLVAAWPSFDQSWLAYGLYVLSLYDIDQTTPEHVIATAGTPASNANIATTKDTLIFGVAVNWNGSLYGNGTLSNFFTQYNSGAEVSIAGYARYASGSYASVGFGGTNPYGVSLVAIAPSPKAYISQPATSINMGGVGQSVTRPALTISAVSTTKETTPYQGTGLSGDTNFCGWVGPSVISGNIGGGALVCTSNDLNTAFGCMAGNVCVYKITDYNTSTGASTISIVNQMASHNVGGGTFGFANCYDHTGTGTGTTGKSRAPFSLPGLLFLPIQCLMTDTYLTRQSGLEVSPDGGGHWCNYKSWLAGGSGGAKTCDAGNWKADGDYPVDAAGYQWPYLTVPNPMGDFNPIDFLCIDGTTNCPNPQGLDPAYLYFHGFDSNSKVYIHRVAKSLGMGIMDPANWQAWQSDGSWGSLFDATDIPGLTNAGMCCSKMQYVAPLGRFVIVAHSSSNPNPIYTAPAPWGPWVSNGSISSSDGGIQFPQFLGGLCPRIENGQINCTMESNGPGGQTLRLHEVTLKGVIPPAMGGR